MKTASATLLVLALLVTIATAQPKTVAPATATDAMWWGMVTLLAVVGGMLWRYQARIEKAIEQGNRMDRRLVRIEEHLGILPEREG